MILVDRKNLELNNKRNLLIDPKNFSFVVKNMFLTISFGIAITTTLLFTTLVVVP
jgi:hypothetical protein